MEKSNNRNNKSIIISLVAVIVILLCAGVTVGFIMHNNSTSQQETQQQGVVFDSNASHYDGTVENNSNDDSGIKIPGYSDITFTSDSTDFPITLLNPEGNPCNFKFSLSLKETGEILCTTDLVKPGDAISGVELEHTLDKGTYTLLINISTYDVESGGEMNGAQVQTELTVE